MEKMKTLTVSGQTYTVCDPEAVRSVNGQTPDAQGNIRVTDDSRAGGLAWSGKHITDCLCPPFTKKAPLAVCTPVEGYPLEAVSHLAAVETPYTSVKLIRCGKNQVNAQAMKNDCTTEENGVVTVTYLANGSRMSRTVPVYIPKGSAVTLSARLLGCSESHSQYATGGIYMITAGGIYHQIDSNHVDENGVMHTYFSVTSDDVVKIQAYVGQYEPSGAFICFDCLQLEIGKKTDYTPYRGDTFTVIPQVPVYGGTYDWTTGVLTDQEGNIQQLDQQQILALPGENFLYSSTGETEVAGRADPAAIIEKLTNAVVALGGNV